MNTEGCAQSFGIVRSHLNAIIFKSTQIAFFNIRYILKILQRDIEVFSESSKSLPRSRWCGVNLTLESMKERQSLDEAIFDKVENGFFIGGTPPVGFAPKKTTDIAKSMLTPYLMTEIDGVKKTAQKYVCDAGGNGLILHEPTKDGIYRQGTVVSTGK